MFVYPNTSQNSSQSSSRTLHLKPPSSRTATLLDCLSFHNKLHSSIWGKCSFILPLFLRFSNVILGISSVLYIQTQSNLHLESDLFGLLKTVLVNVPRNSDRENVYLLESPPCFLQACQSEIKIHHPKEVAKSLGYI